MNKLYSFFYLIIGSTLLLVSCGFRPEFYDDKKTKAGSQSVLVVECESKLAEDCFYFKNAVESSVTKLSGILLVKIERIGWYSANDRNGFFRIYNVNVAIDYSIESSNNAISTSVKDQEKNQEPNNQPMRIELSDFFEANQEKILTENISEKTLSQRLISRLAGKILSRLYEKNE